MWLTVGIGASAPHAARATTAKSDTVRFTTPPIIGVGVTGLRRSRRSPTPNPDIPHTVGGMNRLIIVSNGARLAADALAKGGWRLARVLPERVIAGYGRGANRSTVTTD